MQKKLIAFEDSLYELIEAYSEKYTIKTFTDAVRRLVEIGLKYKDEQESNVDDTITDLKNKIDKLSWWTSDDNTSRLGNLEIEFKRLEEMEKKINILTAAMKLFKEHLRNREIHLVD